MAPTEMDARLNSVWIAGAGYLGRPLAQHLLAQGFAVVASSRHEVADLACWQQWDLQAASLSAQSFQDAHTWVVLLPPSSTPDYVARMQDLCQQAKALGVRHVIYTSSTSVYGNAARMCDEDSDLSPQTESARKVAACEAIWLQSGLPQVSVLRLGGLYDDARHPVKHLSGKQDIAGGKHLVNVVHRQDAVQVLVNVIAKPQQSVLNVVSQHHPTRAEFYTAEAVRLGMAVPVFNAFDDSEGKIIVSRHQNWSF